MPAEGHRALDAAGVRVESAVRDRQATTACPARAAGDRATRTVARARPSQVPVSRQGEIVPALADTIERERGRGRSLTEPARARAEAVLGADLSDVRVHADAGADALSRSLHAMAFTTGSDVFFRGGAYDPGSRKGMRLIAHELAHVAQQRGAPTHGPLTVGPSDDKYERAARDVGSTVAEGSTAQLRGPIGNRTRGRVLARQPDVGVDVDDRRLEAVSPDVAGVRDIDVGWYRRLNALRAGGRLRVDPGNIWKDPTDLRVDVLGLHPANRDQLVLHGSVQLDGFDAIHGEMTLRLRFKNPSKLLGAARAVTPDELWQRLEPTLHAAVPGLDTRRLVQQLKGLLGQLAKGELTPEAFLKLVEQSVRSAAKG